MSKGSNQPPPIIVKKIIQAGHGGHHGGAWKVAYADFVTAMMAFFLLMWLLGATTEKQRKALADYFSPTVATTKTDSAGANGLFGGESIVSVDKYPNRAGQTGTRALTVPIAGKGGPKDGGGRGVDEQRFAALRDAMAARMTRDKALRRLMPRLRFTDTQNGLRIDMVDDADFAMFEMGTAVLTPDAARLLVTLGQAIRELPNGVTIRGHTDASPWTAAGGMNNWRLSAERAEMTRATLAGQQVAPFRFLRIEGVADREPYKPDDLYSPNNRRISVTLTWTDAPRPPAT